MRRGKESGKKLRSSSSFIRKEGKGKEDEALPPRPKEGEKRADPAKKDMGFLCLKEKERASIEKRTLAREPAPVD